MITISHQSSKELDHMLIHTHLLAQMVVFLGKKKNKKCKEIRKIGTGQRLFSSDTKHFSLFTLDDSLLTQSKAMQLIDKSRITRAIG